MSARDHRAPKVGADPGMASPARPSTPLASTDVRIMLAWMRAAIAHPGDVEAAMAAVESVILNAEVVDPRRVLGKHYYRVPAAIRPLLGQRDGVGLKELLGHFVKYERWEQQALAAAALKGRRTNPETGWIEGVAGLTEQETRAYWKRIAGATRLEIARDLTDDRDRWSRANWLSLKTVSNLCWQAKVKVLRAFGLPARGDAEEEWPDEA